MKTLFGIVLALLLVAAAASPQQKQSGMGIPAYSPSQEKTFSGIVTEVKDYQCPVTGTIGSHITVKGGLETLEVHLAPATFLKEYGIVLSPGDRVEVTGVKFIFEGKPAMLAATVVAGRNTYTFRDTKGRPEW